MRCKRHATNTKPTPTKPPIHGTVRGLSNTHTPLPTHPLAPCGTPGTPWGPPRPRRSARGRGPAARSRTCREATSSPPRRSPIPRPPSTGAAPTPEPEFSSHVFGRPTMQRSNSDGAVGGIGASKPRSEKKTDLVQQRAYLEAVRGPEGKSRQATGGVATNTSCPAESPYYTHREPASRSLLRLSLFNNFLRNGNKYTLRFPRLKRSHLTGARNAYIRTLLSLPFWHSLHSGIS